MGASEKRKDYISWDEYFMGIASKTLKRNGMSNDAKEMCDRITSSGSYDEALSIIDEYVEITSADDEETEDFGMEMM